LTTAPKPARPAGEQRALFIALVVAAAAGLLIRIPSIAEPLSIDQGLLASAARCLSRGMLLYRDVFDQKPPAIYYTYVAGFNLFGWTPAAVAWLDILASAATAVLIFAVVRRTGTRLMGAFATALYCTLTIPSWVYKWGGVGERSVAENFIVVWIALAAWCAAALRERSSAAPAAAMGFCVGAAMVYKPNAGLYLPALLLWLGYTAFSTLRWRGIARATVVAGIGTAVPVLATLFWIWQSGAWPEARVALVDFNRFYVGANFSPGAFVHAFKDRVGFYVKYDPLWLGGALATTAVLVDALRRRKLDATPALAVAWGGASALMIASNGARLFPTYFILAMAPLSILIAWFFAVAIEPPARYRYPAMVTALAMVALLAYKNYPAKVFTWFQADVRQLMGVGDRSAFLQRFGGYNEGRPWSARADDEVNRYVREHSSPDSLIYQFGINDAEVYFAADRLPAAKFLRVNMFVPPGFPAPDFQLSAVADTLAARRPEYLIFEHFQGPAALADAINQLPDAPELRGLLAGYRLETRIEDFTLYRRLP